MYLIKAIIVTQRVIIVATSSIIYNSIKNPQCVKMNYAVPVDTGFDFLREEIYELFTDYFSNPTLTKIKDVEKFSMYMVKIHAMLGVEYRYLILFVARDSSPPGTQISMSKLPWNVLQTRTLKDEHNIFTHGYVPRIIDKLNKNISLGKIVGEYYEYNVQDFPMKITLIAKTKPSIQGPPQERALEYNKQGTVIPALETYQTIVSFL
jgi:hypothetical protein